MPPLPERERRRALLPLLSLHKPAAAAAGAAIAARVNVGGAEALLWQVSEQAGTNAPLFREADHWLARSAVSGASLDVGGEGALCGK